MTDIQDLITRVETGSGADQRLDGLIADRFRHKIPDGFTLAPAENPFGCRFYSKGSRYVDALPYTISLDACRSLQKAVLPGLPWWIGPAPFTSIWGSEGPKEAKILVYENGYLKGEFTGQHKDETRAWTLAILRAVETKGADKP